MTTFVHISESRATVSNYIFSDILTDYYSNGQKAELKSIRPKLRQSKRMLVTRKYEPNAITYQEQNNLVGRVINMYDYFQGTIANPKEDLHIRLSHIFDLSQVKIVGINADTSKVFKDGNQIAEVQIAPLSVQIIGIVTWLNVAGEPVSRDFYDRRGFKTSTQYFHLTGNIGHQIIYDRNGRPKIEMIMMAINGVEQLTSIKLLGYLGADYLFANENELWEFFKNELKSNDWRHYDSIFY